MIIYGPWDYIGEIMCAYGNGRDFRCDDMGLYCFI